MAALATPPPPLPPAAAPPSPAPPRGWRARGRHLWQAHPRALLLGLLLLVGLPLLWGHLDLARLHTWAEHVNPALLFAALVLLPLATVPVTPLNLLAGIRFGLGGGLAFVAAAILCQHLLAYAAARALPQFLRAKLDPLRRRLPAQAHRDATIFTALIPGAPYWAQLYVLPLIGVPPLIFLTLSTSLHAIRSLTAVIAGQVSDDPSVGWVLVLATYSGLLAVACFFAGRRMARKTQQVHFARYRQNK